MTGGLMGSAHAPTVSVITLVSAADMGSAHAPTVSVIALVSDADKWPNA